MYDVLYVHMFNEISFVVYLQYLCMYAYQFTQ